MSLRATLLLLASLALPACGSEVDLAQVTLAAAGCTEAPTPELLHPQAIMLPGHQCLTCHQAGGNASRFPWTAAGTVFKSANSPCNTGGAAGVEVKLADETGLVLVTLVTNRTGNFYTREPLNFKQLRVEISKDGKKQVMAARPGANDCALCHRPGGVAGARIYLE